MKHQLIPSDLSFFDLDFLPSRWFSDQSGLSVYEDKNEVVVEAALPGMRQEDIEITMNEHVLQINANKQEKEEDKKKKYYKKATSAYNYHLTLPSNVDEKGEPSAHFKNGVMQIRFKKKGEQNGLKKIKFKAE
jgi:HSP20 family protein